MFTTGMHGGWPVQELDSWPVQEHGGWPMEELGSWPVEQYRSWPVKIACWIRPFPIHFIFIFYVTFTFALVCH